jgi:hypothetical protein
MDLIYDDGGRADAGFRGDAGDCVTRAVAIATGRPYREVYDELFARIRRTRRYKASGSGARCTTPRNYTPKKVTREYIESLGWRWVPTMAIGQGCTTHLRADELPAGPVIVSLSKHVCAVIDGVIHDTHDPSRDGTRCVYGYYVPAADAMTDDEIEYHARSGRHL